MPSNPFDQFDTAAKGGGNPFDQFDAPAVAKTVQKSGAGNPITDTALSFADSFALGLGRKNPFMTMPEGFEQDIKQAHQNLGWMDYPLSAAAYALGPGKVLGAGGMTAGLAGRPIAQAAAEGALAGGISDAAQGGNPLIGAAGGAALGGAAGGIGKGIGKLAAGRAPEIDPAAEVARTQGLKETAYGRLSSRPMDPVQTDSAIGGVMSSLDPSVATGMSPGLKSTVNGIRQALQEQATLQQPIHAGMVDSWVRQIQAAAQRERYPTDKIVAGQLDEQLSGLINQAGAGDLRAAAQEAHSNYALAQNMADWQARIKAGGSVGMGPLNEAETYYQGDPVKYSTLADLYQQSQNPTSKLGWALGHLGASVAGFGGHALGGFPGAVGSEALWYLKGKPALTKALKGYDRNQLLKAYQAAYGPLTGATVPTAAPPSPAMGDAIKTLMLGSAY